MDFYELTNNYRLADKGKMADEIQEEEAVVRDEKAAKAAKQKRRRERRKLNRTKQVASPEPTVPIPSPVPKVDKPQIPVDNFATKGSAPEIPKPSVDTKPIANTGNGKKKTKANLPKKGGDDNPQLVNSVVRELINKLLDSNNPRVSGPPATDYKADESSVPAETDVSATPDVSEGKERVNRDSKQPLFITCTDPTNLEWARKVFGVNSVRSNYTSRPNPHDRGAMMRKDLLIRGIQSAHDYCKTVEHEPKEVLDLNPSQRNKDVLKAVFGEGLAYSGRKIKDSKSKLRPVTFAEPMDPDLILMVDNYEDESYKFVRETYPLVPIIWVGTLFLNSVSFSSNQQWFTNFDTVKAQVDKTKQPITHTHPKKLFEHLRRYSSVQFDKANENEMDGYFLIPDVDTDENLVTNLLEKKIHCFEDLTPTFSRWIGIDYLFDALVGPKLIKTHIPDDVIDLVKLLSYRETIDKFTVSKMNSVLRDAMKDPKVVRFIKAFGVRPTEYLEQSINYAIMYQISRNTKARNVDFTSDAFYRIQEELNTIPKNNTLASFVSNNRDTVLNTLIGGSIAVVGGFMIRNYLRSPMVLGSLVDMLFSNSSATIYIITIVMEELVRHKLGRFSSLIGIVEWMTKVVYAIQTNKIPELPYTLPPLAMHLVLDYLVGKGLPFWASFLIHIVYNHIAIRLVVYQATACFGSVNKLLPLLLLATLIILYFIRLRSKPTKYEGTAADVKKRMQSGVPSDFYESKMIITGPPVIVDRVKCLPYDEPKDDSYTQIEWLMDSLDYRDNPTLYFTFSLYGDFPSNCFSNIENMTNRLAFDRPKYNLRSIVSGRELHKHIEIVSTCFEQHSTIDKLDELCFKKDVLVDDWLEHIKKKPNGKKTLDVFLNGSKLSTTTQLFQKTNERVLSLKNVGGLVKPDMKNRPIMNVDKSWIAELGPVIYGLQNRVKIIMDGKIVNYIINTDRCAVYVKCFYAAKSPIEITEVFNHFKTTKFVPGTINVLLMGMGDDSYVLIKHRGRTYEFETDFKRFDASQTEISQKVQMSMYKDFGLSYLVIKSLEKLSNLPLQYRDRSNKLIFTCSKPHRRDSGSVDTSLGNFCLLVATWIVTLFLTANRKIHDTWDCDRTINNFQQVSGELGFAVEVALKQEVIEDLYLGTFLKGHFVKTLNHGHCWTVLPSRIMKSGAFKTKPDGFMTKYCKKIAKEENKPLLEIQCRCFQHAWAATLMPYKSLPIFEEFINLYYDPLFLTTPVVDVTGTMVSISDQHKDIHYDVDQWMEFLDFRYKLDRSVLEDLCNTMKILKFGQFLIHPALSKFIMVDY
jgi:hypothetical protein